MKNNKGWVELIEAAISILLVTIAILVVINKGYIGKSDVSEEVYKTELSILREIEITPALRDFVLDPLILLPVESSNSDGITNPNFPSEVINKINNRTPSHLKCMGKICAINTACNMNELKETDVYSHSIMISSDTVSRKLILFCWAK